MLQLESNVGHRLHINAHACVCVCIESISRFYVISGTHVKIRHVVSPELERNEHVCWRWEALTVFSEMQICSEQRGFQTPMNPHDRETSGNGICRMDLANYFGGNYLNLKV